MSSVQYVPGRGKEAEKELVQVAETRIVLGYHMTSLAAETRNQKIK